MRVLLSTFTFPPNKDGVSEASAAAVRTFLSQGWSVEVATAPATPRRMSLDWEGARIHEFAIKGSPHFRNPYSGAIEDYRNFLRAGQRDVVVFEGYSWPLDLAVPLLDHISAKKILVSHGYGALRWTPVPKFPFGLGALAYAAFQSLRMLRWARKIDRWVFLSPRTDFHSFYDHWLAQKIRHPGIAVIPNGVDPERRGSPHRFREAWGIPQNALTFLCVGYFSRGKNQQLAIRAYRAADLPNSRLVFIAPDSNEWMVRCQKTAHQLQRSADKADILWLTGLSRELTLDAFAGSDIYLSASTGETQPFALLEAMREAKPWIAMKAGCIPELPGGRCVSSLQEMVQAMHRLAANPSERHFLGQAGRRAIETRFSEVNFSKNYRQLVAALVSGCP